ncbi:hypothetical protein PMAYCL1PPCAC_22069, partial [Pristionchus mayeri]
ERFPMPSGKFVVGSSTIIIGPVTTIEIDDDATVELTLTAFTDKNFYAAQPGFDFTIMSTGVADDMQSSLPSILISTAYGINDDTIAYDSVNITGSVKLDRTIGTTLVIQCFNSESGIKDTDVITQTTDIDIQSNCSTLEITYQGNLDPQLILRSNEAIFLQISSNSVPVIKPSDSPVTTTPSDTHFDSTTVPLGTESTRRSMPPTSTTTASPTTSSSSSSTSTRTSTMRMTTTTSGAASVVTVLIP